MLVSDNLHALELLYLTALIIIMLEALQTTQQLYLGLMRQNPTLLIAMMFQQYNHLQLKH